MNSSASAAQQSGTLTGTLLDPQGTAVANFDVQLRWNYLDNRVSTNSVHSKKEKQPHKKFLRVSTDSTGQFTATLPPGSWDVLAFADGFAPTCTIVLIKAGQATSITLRFPGHSAMSVQ
jgi:hypothetical protein